MFTALTMAMAFCHLLQLSPRMRYEGAMWRRTQSMYENFGPPVGAVIEGGAFLSSMLLSFLVRQRLPASRWTWIGSLFFAIAQTLWWIRIAPINAKIINWRPESLPQGWKRLRVQWEYTHAGRAILMLIGFAALLNSILVETPVTEAFTEEAGSVESPHITQ
jgi:hypothetical protein